LLEQRAAHLGVDDALLVLKQRLDEELALGAAERLELDRRRAHASAAPAGMDVEELCARKAEQEQRRAHPVGEMLDQLEERLLGPVDVLECEDDRLRLGELLHERTGGPGDLLR